MDYFSLTVILMFIVLNEPVNKILDLFCGAVIESVYSTSEDTIENIKKKQKTTDKKVRLVVYCTLTLYSIWILCKIV
jgi:hypothetical protein